MLHATPLKHYELSSAASDAWRPVALAEAHNRASALLVHHIT